MCLQTVDRKIKAPKRGIAYKAVHKIENTYASIHIGSFFEKGVKKYAGEGTLPLPCIGTYPEGFHCYASKKMAKKAARKGYDRVVVKVRLEKVVASGTEKFYTYDFRGRRKYIDTRVYVGKELTILKEVYRFRSYVASLMIRGNKDHE